MMTNEFTELNLSLGAKTSYLSPFQNIWHALLYLSQNAQLTI